MTITARQYVALRLYYCEGQTERRIANILGIRPKNAHQLIVRGRRWIIEESEGGSSSPLIRGLLQPSPTTSTTGRSGTAASRQDELWDALELRMQHRDKELAEIEECMAHDSDASVHRAGADRCGISIGPNGTCWPAEKWIPPGQVNATVLPCDERGHC